jgi:hypothetical protein
MDHLWAPVGTGVRPQSETDHVATYLFGDADARSTVEEMQATLNELPGLEGSTFLSDAVAAAKARSGVADA